MRTIVLALTILLALPAMAEAALWRGKTRQGQPVSVRTGADGVVKKVRIGFVARCDDGKGFERGVKFLPPLDAASTNAVRDGGAIEWTFTKSREHAKGRTSIDGGLRRSGRWTGAFRLRVKIRKDGRVIATCRTGRVGWRASPR